MSARPNSSFASYVLSAVSILSGIFVIFLQQFIATRILAPIAGITVQTDGIDKYGGESLINGLFKTVVVYVPLIAGAGLIIIGFAIEYRRRRSAAAQQALGGRRR